MFRRDYKGVLMDRLIAPRNRPRLLPSTLCYCGIQDRHKISSEFEREEMRKVNLLRIITLLSCLPVVTGCIATHRSNTAWLEEATHVGILYPQEQERVGQTRFSGGMTIAADAAVWALSEVLKWEAGKYLNDSKGKRPEANLLHSDKATATSPRGEGWTLPKSRDPLVYITFIRTVHPKKDTSFWESFWKTLLWYERPTGLEPLNSAAIDDLVRRVQACTKLTADFETTWPKIIEAYGLGNDVKQGSYLGFMALLQIKPTEPHDTAGNSLNYRIELVDYRYSSLKAKNLSWIRIPFTDWEDTKSLLKITLQGPKEDSRFPNGQYSPSTEFTVNWDRKLSGNIQPSKWVNDTCHSKDTMPDPWSQSQSPLDTSLPFKAFDLRNINIYLQLVEAGSLKDAFELASKKAGDIDAKKLLKKE